MNWEFVLLISAMVAEIAIIFLMIRGSAFRSFPIFSFYICWSLLSDALLYYVRVDHPGLFFRIYLAQLICDSLMIFALLVELAWNVLRPIRTSLPRYSWLVITILFAASAAVLWPVAGLAAPERLTSVGRYMFLLQLTPAILRAVFFLSLAALSQLLAVGWRDRELQIATGLGFYSIVSLVVTIAHTHQSIGQSQWGVLYHWLDRLDSFSYLAALVYWVFAFATKPVERREFTPQMQSMLLAVAGAARATRVGLNDSQPGKPRR